MPLSTEFLVSILVTIAFVSVLSGALLLLIEESKKAELQVVQKANVYSIAIQLALDGNIKTDFEDEFRVEQSRLHIYKGGKLIEIPGVYECDYNEPV